MLVKREESKEEKDNIDERIKYRMIVFEGRERERSYLVSNKNFDFILLRKIKNDRRAAFVNA